MSTNPHELDRTPILARARIEEILLQMPHASSDETSRRVAERLCRNDINMTADKSLRSGTLTDFKLVFQRPPTGAYFSLPVIAMKPDEVLMASKEFLQADLARTAAIADMYPEHGYEDPLDVVLRRGFEQQEQFLNNTNAAEIPFDPRKINKDLLITIIQTPTQEFCGMGIADFTQILRENFEPNTPKDTEGLARLVNDIPRFVAERSALMSLVNEEALSILSRFSPNERKRFVGIIIFELMRKRRQSA